MPAMAAGSADDHRVEDGGVGTLCCGAAQGARPLKMPAAMVRGDVDTVGGEHDDRLSQG